VALMMFGMGGLEMSCKWIEIRKEDLLDGKMPYVYPVSISRINLDLCISIHAADKENTIDFETKDDLLEFVFASSELFYIYWDMIEVLIRP